MYLICNDVLNATRQAKLGVRSLLFGVGGAVCLEEYTKPTECQHFSTILYISSGHLWGFSSLYPFITYQEITQMLLTRINHSASEAVYDY